MNRRVPALPRVASCACLAILLAACGRKPEDRKAMPAVPSTPAEWRAALAGGPIPDDLQQRLRADAIARPRLLEILAGLLDDPDPSVRSNALSLLESRRPYELAEQLAGHLQAARDPHWAAALLSALREATRVEAGAIAERVDERKLADAFEVAQKVFRSELSDPGNHPLRFEEAVYSIADVFPTAEGDRLFSELDQRLHQPGEPVIKEAKLHGLWLEFKVGAAGGDGYQEIVEFVRSHPRALDHDGTRERLVELLRIAPGPVADGRDAYDELISMIEPGEAADDSYVRWLALKTGASGGADTDWLRLLPTLTPMRQAALIHFAGIDFASSLEAGIRDGVRDQLQRAAEVQTDPGHRAFLHDASASLETRPAQP